MSEGSAIAWTSESSYCSGPEDDHDLIETVGTEVNWQETHRELQRAYVELEAERDAAYAVIEQLRNTGGLPVDKVWVRWREIFSTSGAEALEARDAEKWDEGYTVGNRHDGRRDANPYRTTDAEKGKK